jgi:hypothetical protein
MILLQKIRIRIRESHHGVYIYKRIYRNQSQEITYDTFNYDKI